MTRGRDWEWDGPGSQVPKSKPGDYVELIDENDEGAGVVIKRADGSPFAYMSMKAYLYFRETDSSLPVNAL